MDTTTTATSDNNHTSDSKRINNGNHHHVDADANNGNASLAFATKAVHGHGTEETFGAVMVPIYQTSTYAQHEPGEPYQKGFDYGRTNNPTRLALEKAIAMLENSKYALAFSSGLATTNALLHLCKAGDHVVSSDDVYGGTFRIFDKVFKKLGVEFSFTDLSSKEKQWQKIIKEKPNTKMIWMEALTNPMLKIPDIKEICTFAKEHGIVSVVDATFVSPYFLQALDLGADIVLHSCTKYINGHSDVINGVLATNREDLYKELKFYQNSVGGVPGPMDCFLCIRGMKTLHLRMERHASNALKIAQYLEKCEWVEKVIYPGLESHPQHELAKKQFKNGQSGGMISFVIKGGMKESKKFLESVKIFTLAESLGGVESLIELPAVMTHASIPPESRAKIGIHDTLIRISVGVEDIDDLIKDLDSAGKATLSQ